MTPRIKWRSKYHQKRKLGNVAIKSSRMLLKCVNLKNSFARKLKISLEKMMGTPSNIVIATKTSVRGEHIYSRKKNIAVRKTEIYLAFWEYFNRYVGNCGKNIRAGGVGVTTGASHAKYFTTPNQYHHKKRYACSQRSQLVVGVADRASQTTHFQTDTAVFLADISRINLVYCRDMYPKRHDCVRGLQAGEFSFLCVGYDLLSSASCAFDEKSYYWCTRAYSFVRFQGRAVGVKHLLLFRWGTITSLLYSLCVSQMVVRFIFIATKRSSRSRSCRSIVFTSCSSVKQHDSCKILPERYCS